jgi:HK97 family phage major capsid protein
MLGDPAQMKGVLGDAAAFQEFIKNYAHASYSKDQALETQIREQVQAGLAEFIKDNRAEGTIRPDLTPASPKLGAQGTQYNPKALGAQLDGEFENAADVFRTIWHNTDVAMDAKAGELRRKMKNAFGSGVPADGGFLIPETLRSELLRIGLENSVVRSRARVIPMDSLRVPFPAIDSTTNATSVYGGVVGYWTEEAAALTASQASFGRVVLDAKKLTTYTEVPNELISDSIVSFNAFINQLFPEAMGFYEDKGFTTGTGVGEPLGWASTTNTATVVVNKESGQAASTIVYENITKMYARMLPSSLNRAVWVCSPDCIPELLTMALSVGTGGAPIFQMNASESMPMSLLGRPLVVTEKVSALGTQGDLSFVDFGFYLIGDRQAMSATSSEHYKFNQDVTAFRIIERVDGRPWVQSAITPANGSTNTLSPFVQLQAR